LSEEYYLHWFDYKLNPIRIYVGDFENYGMNEAIHNSVRSRSIGEIAILEKYNMLSDKLKEFLQTKYTPHRLYIQPQYIYSRELLEICRRLFTIIPVNTFHFFNFLSFESGFPLSLDTYYNFINEVIEKSNYDYKLFKYCHNIYVTELTNRILFFRKLLNIEDIIKIKINEFCENFKFNYATFDNFLQQLKYNQLDSKYVDKLIRNFLSENQDILFNEKISSSKHNMKILLRYVNLLSKKDKEKLIRYFINKLY